MEARSISGKNEIHNFLKKAPGLNLYLLGDLDDFFWPFTKWYALFDGDEIKTIALLYTGMETPTLLCLYDGDAVYSEELLDRIMPLLPKKFYAHLGMNLKEIFRNTFSIKDIGHDFRMILKKPPEVVSEQYIRKLNENDLPVVKKLYEIAYPENWFDSRMLETGKYFGYFTDSLLTGIAGIHVYSEKYSIAALGNIATHPGYRGNKIAYKLTCCLCTDLLKSVKTIGLNVKSDNIPAIRCYINAGFEVTGSFDECLMSKD